MNVFFSLAGVVAQQKLPPTTPEPPSSILASPVFWAAAIAAGFGLVNVLVTALATSSTNRRTAALTNSTQRINAELVANTQRELAEQTARTQEQIANSNAEHNIKLEEIKSQFQAQRDDRQALREQLKTIAKYKDPLMHAGYDLQSRLFNIVRTSFLDLYYNRGTEAQRV